LWSRVKQNDSSERSRSRNGRHIIMEYIYGTERIYLTDVLDLLICLEKRKIGRAQTIEA